ncbi:MAG: hypothetical protein WCD38_11755 [Candidatus Tumulicola sp.]
MTKAEEFEAATDDEKRLMVRDVALGIYAFFFKNAEVERAVVEVTTGNGKQRFRVRVYADAEAYAMVDGHCLELEGLG